jgi:protein-tyrosine phosphatase
LEALRDEGLVEPQSRPRPVAEPDRSELVGMRVDPPAGDVERHGGVWVASTAVSRDLDWDGCFNVRDLGNLPIRGGGRTRWGATVRADALDGLSHSGWEAAVRHGVRTVIDLRNDDERAGLDLTPRPDAITTVHVPLDVSEDREFWSIWRRGPQFGTPLYYRPHLERFPERNAAVTSAIADAEPGGVAFHCNGGRDRAGQVTMLLLALAGVRPEVIATDYAISFERLPARYAARGEVDQGPALRTFLSEQGTSAETLIIELLATLDVAAYLLDAGLSEDDLRRLRARITGAS